MPGKSGALTRLVTASRLDSKCFMAGEGVSLPEMVLPAGSVATMELKATHSLR